MIKLHLNRFCLCLFCLAISSTVIAQTTEEIYNDDKWHPEFGLNVTAMVAQFIPLNNSVLKDFSLFDYQFKYLRNGKGLRLGLAVDVLENGFGLNRFNFRFGYEHRNVIKLSRMMISGGIDVALLVDSKNLDTLTPDDVPRFFGVGGDVTLGFEYMLFPNVSLGIETLVVISTSIDGMVVRLLPPLSLNVNFRI